MHSKSPEPSDSCQLVVAQLNDRLKSSSLSHAERHLVRSFLEQAQAQAEIAAPEPSDGQRPAPLPVANSATFCIEQGEKSCRLCDGELFWLAKLFLDHPGECVTYDVIKKSICDNIDVSDNAVHRLKKDLVDTLENCGIPFKIEAVPRRRKSDDPGRYRLVL